MIKDDKTKFKTAHPSRIWPFVHPIHDVDASIDINQRMDSTQTYLQCLYFADTPISFVWQKTLEYLLAAREKHGPDVRGSRPGGVCAHPAALAAEASAWLTDAPCGRHQRRAAPRSTGRLTDPGGRHRARKPQVGMSSASPARPPPCNAICLCATHVPRNVFW